jgi:hypothetical protein
LREVEEITRAVVFAAEKLGTLRLSVFARYSETGGKE